MKKREVPSLLLEQYVLDELEDTRRRALEEEFGADLLAAKAAELEKENREFFKKHPASDMKDRIIRRFDDTASAPEPQFTDRTSAPGTSSASPESVKGGSRRPYLIPLLTAAVFALIFAGIFPFLRAKGDIPEGNRIKGVGSHLQVFLKNNGDPLMLTEGAEVKENDVLQIKYIPAGKKYGIIISIDGRGNVTRLFPQSGREAAALEPDESGLLRYAYQLDDAPRFERFFFVTSNESFNVNRVLRAAEHLGGKIDEAAAAELELPKGIDQSSFLLEKVEY